MTQLPQEPESVLQSCGAEAAFGHAKQGTSLCLRAVAQSLDTDGMWSQEGRVVSADAEDLSVICLLASFATAGGKRGRGSGQHLVSTPTLTRAPKTHRWKDCPTEGSIFILI